MRGIAVERWQRIVPSLPEGCRRRATENGVDQKLTHWKEGDRHYGGLFKSLRSRRLHSPSFPCFPDTVRPLSAKMAKRSKTVKKKVPRAFKFTKKFCDNLTEKSETTGIELEFISAMKIRCQIVDKDKAAKTVGSVTEEDVTEQQLEDVEDEDDTLSFVITLEDDEDEEDEDGRKLQKLLMEACWAIAGFLKKLLCWAFKMITGT
ncbi:uncharacterized protein LOC119404103 [Rhipicephalus sanguineus]|uniref:uncharacterized protein LOC119404103 n=1 Tax=Rhipicephalus sanguineus TaxID=34632 RepID=UPI001893F8C5|nr:uncharacterized protein LOC119404103 [Rhipicephalus sanguineus]